MPSTESHETTAYRICSVCEACCGLQITLRDGAVTGIRGAKSDPFSEGYICPKGVALKDLHEDPDRLRVPLIRRNGELVEASWEEAFAEIEKRLPPLLAEHGRNAVGMVVGNPVAHKAGLLLYVPRLARAIGTRNMFSASTLDQMPRQLSSGLMYGSWLSVPVPDIARTDWMLVIGGNPVVSNGSMWTVPDFRGRARALRQRGGKLIVVDPRFTETAALADQHHFIRPGGDVFLLAAMAQVLFAEERVKLGAMGDHVTGLAELEAAIAPFTPEAVAARCGMSAATIRTLARDLASAPSGVVYGRIGTCTQDYGTLASWLIDVLNVLTGNLDRPGGALFPKAAAFAKNTSGAAGKGSGVTTGRHKSRVSKAPEVWGEFPLTCLAEEIETPGEDQIRAVITIGSNPVLSAPGGPRLAKALDQLDFMVSVDIYLNETTRHADVILPGTSPLEEPHFDVAFPQLAHRNCVRFNPAILPMGDRPPEWQILTRLAAIAEGKGAQADPVELDTEAVRAEVSRLAGDHTDTVMKALDGQDGPVRMFELALRAGPYGDRFGLTPDGLNLAKVIAAGGVIDIGPLQPRVPEVLRTPSGKIELAPPSLIADLARPARDLQTPAPDLVIIGRRDIRSNNSWMHNLPVLAKGPFRCTALVNPGDAARLHLHDGAPARLSTAKGTVDVVVEVSDTMMPGVVSLPHGWGHDLEGAQLRLARQRPGVNLNALLDETRRDPLSGTSVLSGVPISLAPLPAAE